MPWQPPPAGARTPGGGAVTGQPTQASTDFLWALFAGLAGPYRGAGVIVERDEVGGWLTPDWCAVMVWS